MKTFILITFLTFSGIIALGQPKIKFDSLEYAMNPVKVGERAELKIPFKNIGNQPLVITRTQGNGIPIVSSSKEPIPPNGTGFIEFSWPADRVVTTTQAIYVSTNMDDSVIRLSVKLQVIEKELIQNKVFGTVTDEDGVPIAGAHVFVETTKNGIYTDIDGKYVININPNQNLIFGGHGYKFKRVSADKNEINVVLPISVEKVRERVSEYNLEEDIRLKKSGKLKPKPFGTAADAKHDFKKLSKKNTFYIYVPVNFRLSETDLLFEQDYNLKYIESLYSVAYMKAFNQCTFKFLNKRFKRNWPEAVKKDAFGIGDFLK